MFSSMGTILTLTTWGESHGFGVGAVLDGVPSGVSLTEADFAADMARRRPGSGEFSTKRDETDAVEILSGTFEGVTTGTPVSLLIRNSDQRSRDYSDIANVFRPGHADFTYDAKFGLRDYRGGGRSSGRETAARVAAGVVAKKILLETGTAVNAVVTELAGLPPEQADEALRKMQAEGDSAGGVITITACGVPKGLGEPVFGKLDAALSAALTSIGAVKAVEFGAGFNAAKLKGSENNDAFVASNGVVSTKTNNAGGVLGGISTGGDVVIRVAVKPTPSVSTPQTTVDGSGESREIAIKGRHDTTIAPRAAVVCEAMTALVLADFLLINCSRKIEYIRRIYG